MTISVVITWDDCVCSAGAKERRSDADARIETDRDDDSAYDALWLAADRDALRDAAAGAGQTLWQDVLHDDADAPATRYK